MFGYQASDAVEVDMYSYMMLMCSHNHTHSHRCMEHKHQNLQSRQYLIVLSGLKMTQLHFDGAYSFKIFFRVFHYSKISQLANRIQRHQLKNEKNDTISFFEIVCQKIQSLEILE